MTKTIASEFRSYCAAVMPPDVGAAQVRETELAFFAGASALLGLVTGGLTAGPDAEDEDLEMMDRLQKEMDDFLEAYLRRVDAEIGAVLAESERAIAAGEVDPTAAAPTHDYRVPVEAAADSALKDIGRRIKSSLPPGWGFTLMLFTYGEGGTMTYLSSADRADMLRMLQEFMRSQAS